MKKNYFLLLLMTVMMAVGGGKAWGQTTTTIYERGTSSSTAWTSADANDWTKSSNGDLSLTDGYYQITTNANGDHSWLKTITYDKNAILDVEADIRLFSNTGRYLADGCASYFRFGNIYIAENDQDKASAYSLSSFSGSNNTKFTMSGASYRSSGVDYYIKMQINTATNTLVYLYVYPSASSTTASLSIENQVLSDYDYSTIGVGFFRGKSHNSQKTEIIRSVKITQTKQSVQTADYTINYVYANNIIKSETGISTVGSAVSAETPITIDGTKYYASEGADTEFILGTSNNEFNVDLRLGLTVTGQIKAVDSEQNEITIANSAVINEEESIQLPYPLAVNANGKWYETTRVNDYRKSLSYDAPVSEVTYAESDRITYFFDNKDYTIVSKRDDGYYPERGASNFDAVRLAPGGYLYTPALSAGIYTVTLNKNNSNSADQSLDIEIRDGEGNVTSTGLAITQAQNAFYTESSVENVMIPDGGMLQLSNKTTWNSNMSIDYIILKKTADIATSAYTINYQYEGETLQSETGDAVVGAEVNAQESITVTTGEGEEATTQTYYVAENQTTSMTIDADAANNVLNVALRLPLTEDVVINAVDEEGNVLKSFTAEATEGGDKVNVYYTRAVEVEGVYYTVPAKNGGGDNYAIKKAYGEEPTEITYTKDEEISYYAESENLNKSRSYAAEGQAPSRASGGHWWRLAKNSHAYTPALEGGVYKVVVSGRGERAAEVGIQVRYPNGTLVGENTLSWGSTENAEKFVEDVNVPEGCSVAVVNFTDGNNNLGLDYVILYKTGEAKTELITITSAGAATYCSEKVLNFEASEALTAYYLKMDGDELMKSNAIMVVPANTGIYLEGAEGTYEIPIASANDIADNTEDNVLQGVIEETQVVAPIYVLMNESNGVGFYKTKNTFTVGAHTAYISGSAVPTGVKALNINSSDDPTTAIRGISNDAVAGKDAVIYSLAGQRVTVPTKGIYIVNGKKVMVK